MLEIWAFCGEDDKREEGFETSEHPDISHNIEESIIDGLKLKLGKADREEEEEEEEEKEERTRTGILLDRNRIVLSETTDGLAVLRLRRHTSTKSMNAIKGWEI